MENELAFYKLDKRLTKIVNQKEKQLSGLVCLVFADGEIKYKSCFGSRFIDYRNPENDLPVNLDTKFRIASISKTVATLGAMQLVEQGLLDLDKDVSDYLGFELRNPHFPGNKITTRMLLSHTSSLRDGETYILPFPHHMKEFFLPQGLYYEKGAHFACPDEQNKLEPGKYFCYCNLNYGVLGTIMEALSGKRFDHYMLENVLQPLQIDGSYNVRLFSDESLKNLGAIYTKSKDEVWDPQFPWAAQIDDYQRGHPAKVIRVDESVVRKKYPDFQNDEDLLSHYIPGTNGTLFSPQGGLRISVLDLYKIVQLFLNEGEYMGKQIVSSASIKTMMQPQWVYDEKLKNGDTYNGQMTEWGLSLKHLFWKFQTSQGEKQTGLWGHFGDAYGLLSAMMFEPEKKAGFIYFIGGVGADPEETPGIVTPFYLWEEQIIQAVFEEILQDYL